MGAVFACSGSKFKIRPEGKIMKYHPCFRNRAWQHSSTQREAVPIVLQFVNGLSIIFVISHDRTNVGTSCMLYRKPTRLDIWRSEANLGLSVPLWLTPVIGSYGIVETTEIRINLKWPFRHLLLSKQSDHYIFVEILQCFPTTSQKRSVSHLRVHSSLN